MRGIGFQRLKVKGNSLLRIAGLKLNVAEIAPAGRQGRRQPQRRLVARGGRFQIAARHVRVAEIGVQFCDCFSRNQIRRSGRDAESGLVGGNGLVDPARGVMIESDVQGSFRQDVGGNRCET